MRLRSASPRAQSAQRFPRPEEYAMKRMHVHVAVEDIPSAIGFYSALFAATPAVVKPDYAKWMLDDPRVNFAISTRGRQPGLDHLGIQVERPGRIAGSLCASAQGGRAMSSSRDRPPVATRNRKSRGSTIRRASLGRRFSRRAKPPSTATAAVSARPAWRTPRPVAYLSRPSPRRRQPCGCPVA